MKRMDREEIEYRICIWIMILTMISFTAFSIFMMMKDDVEKQYKHETYTFEIIEVKLTNFHWFGQPQFEAQFEDGSVWDCGYHLDQNPDFNPIRGQKYAYYRNLDYTDVHYTLIQDVEK